MRGLNFFTGGYFPFCIEQADGIWDGETRYTKPGHVYLQGVPSMSEDEWKPAVGPGTAYPVGMTLSQVAKLYWRTLEVKTAFTIDLTGDSGWASWPDDVDGPWPATGIMATFTQILQERVLMQSKHGSMVCGVNGTKPVTTITGGPTENSAGTAHAYLSVSGASATAFLAEWQGILDGEWDGGEAPEGEEIGLYFWPTTWSNYASMTAFIDLFNGIYGFGKGLGAMMRIEDTYYPRLIVELGGNIFLGLSSDLLPPDGYFDENAVFAPSGDGYETTWSHHSREPAGASYSWSSLKGSEASTFTAQFLTEAMTFPIYPTFEPGLGGEESMPISLNGGKLSFGGFDSLVISMNRFYTYGGIYDEDTGERT